MATAGADAISPDMMKQAAQIWANLDEMAKNDPEAYTNFIANSKKQAESAIKRIVDPGLAVFAGGYPKGSYVINMCQSVAVAAPTDPQNIPILVSERRKVQDTIVFDCVFHNNVLEKCLKDSSFSKEILGLARGCITELFGVKLDESCIHVLNQRLYLKRTYTTGHMDGTTKLANH